MAALHWLIHTWSPHSSIKRLFLFFVPSSVLFSLFLSLTSAFLLLITEGWGGGNETLAHPGCSGARWREEELLLPLLPTRRAESVLDLKYLTHQFLFIINLEISIKYWTDWLIILTQFGIQHDSVKYWFIFFYNLQSNLMFGSKRTFFYITGFQPNKV